MPTYVNPDKRDGCRALDRPACMSICPMDSMAPDSAIDMRGYADVMPMGATLKPVRGTHSIIWTANYRDGRIKRFKIPIRTTPWGTITTFPDDARPGKTDLKSPELFGERKYLGVDRLPMPGASPGAS